MPDLTLMRPIDPILMSILQHVDEVARELAIEYVVVGAMARDLILQHTFDLDTGRATRDVDIGIGINDWHQLRQFKERLIESACFRKKINVPHRLYFHQQGSGFEIPLDLLPFGTIENEHAFIAWPPDWQVLMNVSGFSQAFAARQWLQVAPHLRLPVAPLAALAILKLVAWRERHLLTSKDASDFLLIARHYCNAGNMDRLYDEETEILKRWEFDPEAAGAMLLGKDALAICDSPCQLHIQGILKNHETREKLLDQMHRLVFMSGALQDAERILNAFASGFTGS